MWLSKFYCSIYTEREQKKKSSQHRFFIHAYNQIIATDRFKMLSEKNFYLMKYDQGFKIVSCIQINENLIKYSPFS